MLLLTLCSFSCRHPIHHSRLCVSLPWCLSGHLSPAHFLAPDPRLQHRLYLDHCIYVLNSLCLSPSISHSALSSQNERDSNHVSLWCHTLQWLEATLGTCPNSLLSWISWPYTMGSLPKPRCCCFSQSLCYATLAFSRFQKVPCFFHGLFQSP